MLRELGGVIHDKHAFDIDDPPPAGAVAGWLAAARTVVARAATLERLQGAFVDAAGVCRVGARGGGPQVYADNGRL